MDTTTVATAAIAAMAGLGGGLGGAMIAARHQQSAERSRQRERAAEVFGAMGPLLTELHPDRIYMNLPLPPEPGQADPMTETLRTLHEQAREVRQQLSMLAAWWPTSEGSDLARRLEVALLSAVIWDTHLVRDARAGRNTTQALEQARSEWNQAKSVADALRSEVRAQPVPDAPGCCLGRSRSGWRRPPGRCWCRSAAGRPGGSVWPTPAPPSWRRPGQPPPGSAGHGARRSSLADVVLGGVDRPGFEHETDDPEGGQAAVKGADANSHGHPIPEVEISRWRAEPAGWGDAGHVGGLG
jgi:hypothetical protein